MALVYLVALKIPPSSVSRGTINASAQKQVQTRRRSTSHSNMRRSPKQNKNKKGSATRELGMHATRALSLWHCITPDHAAAAPSHDVSRTRSWMLSRPAISFRMEFSLEEERGRRLVAGSKGEAAGTVNGDLQESIED
ncbi:hypothetical protein TEQG_01824 [Trichophyton equinum CBS 127.97]|uniref:Uncharacterized protein n=1 Tax=Trichophyton equinum (strain ATCC MYA-4606 / CBS 127.97) TaxID=559882 RepID=F2PLL8_TRIEC|nr:hypothetical protein TEQG_01824 [Trichophyton equinum CBS 127.97]